jgi:hypothetical protein
METTIHTNDPTNAAKPRHASVPKIPGHQDRICIGVE